MTGRVLSALLIGALVIAGFAVRFADTVSAAEQAKGIYLLGSKGPQAGMLPPPGVFAGNTVYSYVGDAAPSLEVPFGGNVLIDAEATIIIDAPSLLWVPDVEVLGGHMGFFGLVPIGHVGVAASAILTGPGGVPILNASTSQDSFTIGDPQAGAVLGWNSGAFHWNVGVLANVPIGDYSDGAIDNLAFNRWAVDLNASATWLDPKTGLELSASAGITFNGENSDTDYETGDEFHLEFAALKHVSQEFSFGLVGYHYEQITGDSGSGAVLGGFKGRVTALGPHVAYTFPVNHVPVTVAARFLSEFNTKNRLEGNAGYVTINVPLFVARPPVAPGS